MLILSMAFLVVALVPNEIGIGLFFVGLPILPAIELRDDVSDVLGCLRKPEKYSVDGRRLRTRLKKLAPVVG